jgi:hypothetical protein
MIKVLQSIIHLKNNMDPNNITTQEGEIDQGLAQRLDEIMQRLSDAEAEFEQETKHLAEEIKTDAEDFDQEFKALSAEAIAFEKEFGDEIVALTLEELAEEETNGELDITSNKEPKKIIDETTIEEISETIQRKPQPRTGPGFGDEMIKPRQTAPVLLTNEEITIRAEHLKIPLATYIDEWNKFARELHNPMFPELKPSSLLHQKIVFIIKDHPQELGMYSENSMGWKMFNVYLMRYFAEQGIDIRTIGAQLGSVLTAFKRRMIEGGHASEVIDVPKPPPYGFKKFLAKFGIR